MAAWSEAMSDLVQRLRSGEWTRRGPEIVREAADRIEADEALMRKALEALISLSKDHTYVKPTERAIIAALRERLGDKHE